MLCRPDGKFSAAMPPPARIHQENPASSGLSSRPRSTQACGPVWCYGRRGMIEASHSTPLCPLPMQSPSSTHGYTTAIERQLPHTLWLGTTIGEGKVPVTVPIERHYSGTAGSSCIRVRHDSQSTPTLLGRGAQQYPQTLSDGSSAAA